MGNWYDRSCVTTANFSFGLNGVFEAYQPWKDDWTATTYGYQCEDCDEFANIFWDGNSQWIMSSQLDYLSGSGDKWYFCEEQTLEDCTQGKWAYGYNGNQTLFDGDATIVDHQLWMSTLDDSCSLTSTRSPLEHQTIYCDADPCTIICDEPYGCKNANISAKDLHSVTLRCSTDDACHGLIATMNNVSQITISCSAFHACVGANIIVSESSFVDIVCSGYGSCFEGTITSQQVQAIGDDITSGFVRVFLFKVLFALCCSIKFAS